jgi:peptidoglycan/xylan/chitin deacetylase (PgdA/CDA1 family)
LIAGTPLVACTILLWLAALIPTAAANRLAPECAGRPATIIGTAGDDELQGTRGDDVIVGLAGNDTIVAGPGNDLVCAGPGNDVVSGGSGADTLFGAAGDDFLNGDTGPDRLSGGPGADLLVGEPGNDVLLGGRGDDVLRGGIGADRLYGEGGRDSLIGGDDDDLARGGDDNDTIDGGAGADRLHGGEGADSLLGREGPDWLLGEAGDDLLAGGEGDDTLRGGTDRDRCDGGDGRDDAAACEEVAATEVGQLPRPLFRPGPTQVALTFDDGPSPAYTAQILSVLERYGVPATFFVIGRAASENPAMLQRMAAEGHSVQNHTYDHYWLTRYSDGAVADQLARASRVVEGSTGEAPHCFRPPFGAVNYRVRSVAAGLGLTSIMWDVDPWDWKHPGSAAVASHVLSRTGGGDIVLFHDTAGWSTIGALPAIIEGLRSRGLEFVPLCSTSILAP